MTKFEMALNNFEHKDDVRITYRSFQLNMSSDSTKGKDINQVISERYNISYEEAKVNNDNIIKAASDVGLNYKFDILKLNSTTFAHKLAIYAKQSNKEQSIIKYFSKGYFEEGLDIGNEDDLTNIAAIDMHKKIMKNTSIDLSLSKYLIIIIQNSSFAMLWVTIRINIQNKKSAFFYINSDSARC